MNLTTFLENRKIPFQTIKHEPTYGAQRTAEALHVSGETVAKTVLMRVDGDYVIAVVPATHNVDVPAIKKLLKARRIELATELEFNERFPDCEIGSLPPFGSQYGLKTLLDKALAGQSDVVFESNTHDESVRMRMRDFVRLEQPLQAIFSHHA